MAPVPSQIWCCSLVRCSVKESKDEVWKENYTSEASVHNTYPPISMPFPSASEVNHVHCGLATLCEATKPAEVVGLSTAS